MPRERVGLAFRKTTLPEISTQREATEVIGVTVEYKLGELPSARTWLDSPMQEINSVLDKGAPRQEERAERSTFVARTVGFRV